MGAGARSVLILLIGLGVLVVHPGLSWAADPAAPLAAHAKKVNRAARTPEGERRVLQHLSEELSVPAKRLRAQREESKLGWGELEIAYRLSQKTGIPVEQLIAEHKAGKGWGAIAREHDVKLGPIISEVEKSDRTLEAKAKKAEKRRGGPEVEGEERGKGPGHPGRGQEGHPGGGPGKGRGK